MFKNFRLSILDCRVMFLRWRLVKLAARLERLLKRRRKLKSCSCGCRCVSLQGVSLGDCHCCKCE